MADRLKWIALALAALSIAAGIAQLVFASASLAALGLAPAAGSRLFFRLASLCTALFGCAFLHCLATGSGRGLALWVGLQKLLSAAMLAAAVFEKAVVVLAGSVAIYDALAGAVFLAYAAAGWTPRAEA